MKAAVILTVYNRIESTLRCLEHFYDATVNTPSINYDVFLVDDGSDDSSAIILKMKYPNINIIEGDGNLFWCRGMKLGWYVASQKYSYDLYIWLNNDSYLFEDSLASNILEYSPTSEFIISGAFKSIHNGKTTYGGRLKGQTRNIDPDGSFKEIEWMNGNFVLISRAVFEKIGFLDERFHHAIGDYDYGLRAIKNNMKVYLSKVYVGTCEDRDNYMACYDPEKPLMSRLKHFYSPLGDNPFQRWIFLSRHYSVMKALKVFFITHLFVFFPRLVSLFYYKKSL